MIWFDDTGFIDPLVISVILVAIIAVLFIFRQKIKHRRKVLTRKANAYVDALNELIAGNNVRAMDLLKEAVRFDTNNIDAYIKLGMLYRMQQSPAQALKIHKELIIRSNLAHNQLTEIYCNIVSDLIELKQFDDALDYCEKLLSLEPKNRWGLDIQPKIYEYKKDFKNSFKYLKTNAAKDKEIDHRLALYKIAHGKNLMDRGEFHDARIIFKEAIKLDRSYPAAYLYLGDAYAREDRRDDAVKVWKEFAEAVPHKSYLVFDYLDSAFFESGNYSAMEVFYSDIIEKDPDNYRALLRLGEIYFKKGDKEKALEMTERSLKINPHSPDGLKNLIMYLNKSDDIQVIKEKAMSLAAMVRDSAPFQCKLCGYTTSDILIRCPSCEKWDVFEF